MHSQVPFQLKDYAAVLLHGITYGHCACKKGVACDHPGKHPVKKNFLRSPIAYATPPERSNIGVLTGEVNNLTVLDIDPRNGGNESLARLLADNGGLPETLEVLTGGGGRHLYFSGVTASRHPLPGYPGLDLQGNGSYVVAPPSLHLSGKNYRWVDDSKRIAPLPGFIPEIATKRKETASTGGTDSNRDPEDKKLDLDLVFQGVPEGQRHDQLFCYSARLKRRGLTEDEAKILVEEMARRCSPPYSSEEARESLAAAWKYPNDVAFYYVLNFVKSKDCEYTPSQRFVALHVARYMNRQDTCWPGMKRLADELKVDEGTVASALKVLCAEDGLFSRVGKDSVHGTWIYKLNRETLELVRK